MTLHYRNRWIQVVSYSNCRVCKDFDSKHGKLRLVCRVTPHAFISKIKIRHQYGGPAIDPIGLRNLVHLPLPICWT